MKQMKNNLTIFTKTLGKKKSVPLMLIIAMCLSLTACAGGKDLSLGNSTTDLTKNRNTDKIYCWADTVYAGDEYDEEKANTAVMDFAVRLFQNNMEMEAIGGGEQKNILLSPVSISSAFGMTTFGAKDNTLRQIEAVFGLNKAELNRYNSEYLQSASEELKVANSIWFTNDERVTVKDDFLQFNEETYDTDIYETAFDDSTVRDINAWVEDKTNGMIKELLDQIPQDAVMYLINALAFEAEWQEKYESTDIRDGRFTTESGKIQEVEMMYSDESLYLEDKNAKGFIKYYKDKNYAFVALLPNEDIGLYNYVKTLSGAHLQELLANPIETDVDVRIPQFTTEYEVEMSDVLMNMGMVDAFDSENADFSGMATSTRENIYITRVLHKTFIEVSSEGTKAGAATMIEMADGCVPAFEEIKEVHLDRPFFYMIIDCDGNQPIFMGTVHSVE